MPIKLRAYIAVVARYRLVFFPEEEEGPRQGLRVAVKARLRGLSRKPQNSITTAFEIRILFVRHC